MILYLDSSALVKCYAEEAGTLDTIDLIDAAEMVVTSPITRVEVVSALARGVREGILAPKTGRDAYAAFREEWHSLIQVPMTERVMIRAQDLLWEFGLRAYDAVQLASALIWAERAGGAVTLATFDARLAAAAHRARLAVWPGPIPAG